LSAVLACWNLCGSTCQIFRHRSNGVCGSNNALQTSSLGADYVIDYSKEDFTKSNKRYNLILAINWITIHFDQSPPIQIDHPVPMKKIGSRRAN